MNSAMNAQPHLSGAGLGVTRGLGGFNGCSGLNPFTIKTPGMYVYLLPLLCKINHADVFLNKKNRYRKIAQ